MTRIRMTMIASTSRMWTNPPSVYDVTRPRGHKMMRITATVQSKSIFGLLSKVSSCSSPSLEQVETFQKLRQRVSSFAEGTFGGVSDFAYEVLGVADVLANTANHSLATIDGIIDSVLRGAAEQFGGVFPRLRSEKQTESGTCAQPDSKCRKNLWPRIAT